MIVSRRTLGHALLRGPNPIFTNLYAKEKNVFKNWEENEKNKKKSKPFPRFEPVMVQTITLFSVALTTRLWSYSYHRCANIYLWKLYWLWKKCYQFRGECYPYAQTTLCYLRFNFLSTMKTYLTPCTKSISNAFGKIRSRKKYILLYE